MSYRVDYTSGSKRREISEPKRGGVWMTVAILLILSMTVISLWPAGRAWLTERLIPGDPEVTAAAWETLTEELRCGTDLKSAVTAFCREIISDGGY